MSKSKVPEVITSKFITKVEETGRLPWTRPWELKPNCNYLSKREYTGVNRWMTALSEYGCPYWISFKKMSERGGFLKEDQHGTAIIYLGSGNKTVNEDDQKTYRFLRYYTVFNLEQTTLPIPEEELSKEKIVDVMSIFNKSKLPTIKHGKDQACYSPDRDVIHMPYHNTFRSDESYYSTLFHELIHSTGHTQRLDRQDIFGAENMKRENYAFEELVAEIGCALLCYHTGNFTEDVEQNSIAYLQGWRSRLNNNDNWLMSAASKAEKAVNYLLKEKE